MTFFPKFISTEEEVKEEKKSENWNDKNIK